MVKWVKQADVGARVRVKDREDVMFSFFSHLTIEIVEQKMFPKGQLNKKEEQPGGQVAQVGRGSMLAARQCCFFFFLKHKLHLKSFGNKSKTT